MSFNLFLNNLSLGSSLILSGILLKIEIQLYCGPFLKMAKLAFGSSNLFLYWLLVFDVSGFIGNRSGCFRTKRAASIIKIEGSVNRLSLVK